MENKVYLVEIRKPVKGDVILTSNNSTMRKSTDIDFIHEYPVVVGEFKNTQDLMADIDTMATNRQQGSIGIRVTDGYYPEKDSFYDLNILNP